MLLSHAAWRRAADDLVLCTDNDYNPDKVRSNARLIAKFDNIGQWSQRTDNIIIRSRQYDTGQ